MAAAPVGSVTVRGGVAASRVRAPPCPSRPIMLCPPWSIRASSTCAVRLRSSLDRQERESRHGLLEQGAIKHVEVVCESVFGIDVSDAFLFFNL